MRKILLLVSVLLGGMFGSVCGQQKIEMNLPRMEAFPPYGLDVEGGKFVASWKALDTVPLRGLLAYVGISRNADAGGRQYVLETKIKGDHSLVEGAYKAMRRGVYAHDYMTGLGWLVHEGEVSRQGIVLRKKPSLPDEFTPILQSPVFDASHGGGKFTFKFTASAVPAEGQDTVTLCVYHMPNMRGVKPVVVNLALKADGLPHEYAVEFSGGSAEECVYLSPLTTGAVIVLEGEMGVEQVLEKGDRISQTVALTLLYVTPQNDISKTNEAGVKVDTMVVSASSSAKNVFDYKAHREKGWRMYYVVQQMIGASDGTTARVSETSRPVYFDGKED